MREIMMMIDFTAIWKDVRTSIGQLDHKNGQSLIIFSCGDSLVYIRYLMITTSNEGRKNQFGNFGRCLIGSEQKF